MPYYNCVFVSSDSSLSEFQELLVGRICLFFSFTYYGHLHFCTLVDWFFAHSNHPEEDTSLWIVTPNCMSKGAHKRGVILFESIVHETHLIPIYRHNFLLPDFNPKIVDTLDVFVSYYVNQFVDHHTHTLAL